MVLTTIDKRGSYRLTKKTQGHSPIRFLVHGWSVVIQTSILSVVKEITSEYLRGVVIQYTKFK